MKKICVVLSGGLGNQLFQYAAARSISLATNSLLSIDIHSGFARDFQYKRKFLLFRILKKYTKASFIQTLSISLFKFHNKILKKESMFHYKRIYGDFFYENNFNYHDEVKFDDSPCKYMIGYWQSPKYFDADAELLQLELMPRTPRDQKFVELDLLISQSESVALGIRLYEESKNPADHALHGKVKSVDDINRAIDRLRSIRPTARFFVFSTHRSEHLSKLNLPVNTVFVTPDDGYSDAVDCLWLLTRCRHHIFTNSSYYWWGAWLSHAIHDKDEQLIYAADNFINADGLCEHWNRF